MTDPQIHSLIAQAQANTARIQIESEARVVADEVLAKRIGSLEAVPTGDIQSANYVPGVSGWKLNSLTGDFEINSYTLGSAAQTPERQMVSVEFASWSMYDLPKNAANLLQFMQAELQKVPEEYRHAAEFEEFDASYGDDSFNARLFLSYSRLETEEELADRLEKAKISGTRMVSSGGCITLIQDGVVRWRAGNLRAPLPDLEKPQPFKVDGDQVSINKAVIQDGMITNLKVDDEWSAHIEYLIKALSSNQLALDLVAVISANKDEIARSLAAAYRSSFGIRVRSLTSDLEEAVIGVLRKELKPGGLLHRSR